jgi:hypothetical protein
MSGVLHGVVAAGFANGDEFWNQTSLLLRFNGSNGGTTFTDSSRNNYWVERFGAPALSSTQFKFGGTSAFFDGSNDYLLMQQGTTATIPTTGSYTIEFWIYPTVLKTGHIVGWGTWSGTNQTQTIRLASNGSITDVWFGSGNAAPAGTVVANTWQHIAATYDGTTQRLFKNGVLVASTANSGHNVTKIDNVGIGWLNTAPTGERYQGYIDDVRITKDVARYTANFTPPGAL